MNEELVKPTEIAIKDSKQMINGQVVRAAIFARSKIFEVTTINNESYYLIYYKNAFIYGDKLEGIEEGSFIDHAFQQGVVFDSQHTIMSELLPKSSVTLPNKNKLFAQLQNQYALQETAYIATTLDSFFTRDHIIKVVNKILSYFKRGGKYFKAFQVLQILTAFAPDLQSAKDRFNSLDFLSYKDFYKSSDWPSIQQKDPLYVERYCFEHRFNPEERNLLEDVLRQQDRLFELLLLWLEKAKREAAVDTESMKLYTDIAAQFVSKEAWMLMLEQANINPFQELSEAKSVIETLIQEGYYEQAALHLLDFIDDLPDNYDSILDSLWTNLNAAFIVSHLDDFILVIEQFPHNDQSQSEQKIRQLAVKLLEKHEVNTVHEKLTPIKTIFPQSEVIRDIGHMAGLTESPDRMMELGQYYAQFQQYDAAIDCFSWEMELHPQHATPVEHLSKMYQHKGMPEEAAAYQHILVELKKF